MPTASQHNSRHAQQARELFAGSMEAMLPGLLSALQQRATDQLDVMGNARDMQSRRDAWQALQKSGAAWVQKTGAAWRQALQTQAAAPAPGALSFDAGADSLELLGDEVMESRVLASRLALAVLDLASWELNDLRLRIQSLEGATELARHDLFLPEVLARKMVEQWSLTFDLPGLWPMAQEIIQQQMAEHALSAYHAANEFLIQQGVMAEIDLRPLVRRTPSGLAGESAAADASPPRTPFRGKGGAAAETGLAPLTSPATLAKVRRRAQDVLGNLKRLLTEQVAGYADKARQSTVPLSAQLAHAIVQTQAQQQEDDLTKYHTMRTDLPDSSGAAWAFETSTGPGPTSFVQQLAQASQSLRQRSSSLKMAASDSGEKAIIEIVALMFQSILSEDRIPAAVRVWFARLQMPVLRVAIAEPEFFGSLEHPARRLIDRMGSCVLGFDATVSSGVLEAEIRRVVQVIEQYPESGRRAFQLVHDEFQTFLSQFLSGQEGVAKVATVAQQLEEKETMVIQFTIEMRNMLNDMPVREQIRDFLFKVWAEVLAIAAMKNGPQHAQTIALKRAAADLVWAASAKPKRDDRARVIADLPRLLQLLRTGMSMLGLSDPEQDRHVKLISDTLADAFMSKTDSIPMARIEVMAERLANLEEYLSDEDVGDLPLESDSLEALLGINSGDIQVITGGGGRPTDTMRAWARELQLGAWFNLDHNGQVAQVQFAWRSAGQHFHLFAAADGRNFLIQARRLAAYLQAGLLVPSEEEALTVRATRDALARIDANPERLLG